MKSLSVSLRRLDRLSLMQANAQVLRKSRYPEKNGLYENNLIIRKHNDPALIALILEWWDMLSRYSKRDQLSLVYLLWKHKIQVEENCSAWGDDQKSLRL